MSTQTKGQQHQAGQPEEYKLTDEELDSMIQEALNCPCVKELRASPCGQSFAAAFTCFHRSKAVPKGHDCEDISHAFTECLRAHPAALASLQSASEQGGLSIPPGPPDSPFARGDPVQ